MQYGYHPMHDPRPMYSAETIFYLNRQKKNWLTRHYNFFKKYSAHYRFETRLEDSKSPCMHAHVASTTSVETPNYAQNGGFG